MKGAEIMPLHSSLGNGVRLRLKKKKKKKVNYSKVIGNKINKQKSVTSLYNNNTYLDFDTVPSTLAPNKSCTGRKLQKTGKRDIKENLNKRQDFISVFLL